MKSGSVLLVLSICSYNYFERCILNSIAQMGNGKKQTWSSYMHTKEAKAGADFPF